MHNRNSGEKRGSQNDSHYIVRVPSALKYVYMTMFILGIILFVVFLLFKAKGNASVTTGHLWFSLFMWMDRKWKFIKCSVEKQRYPFMILEVWKLVKKKNLFCMIRAVKNCLLSMDYQIIMIDL